MSEVAVVGEVYVVSHMVFREGGSVVGVATTAEVGRRLAEAYVGRALDWDADGTEADDRPGYTWCEVVKTHVVAEAPQPVQPDTPTPDNLRSTAT